jgi:hypothetical protein
MTLLYHPFRVKYYISGEPCIKSRHSRKACPVLDTGTGIQKDMARHDFWIPTYVGITKRCKNNTYDNPLDGKVDVYLLPIKYL